MKKIVFSEEDIRKIIYYYQEENKTQKWIAEKFKVSRSVIKRILQENNIDLVRRDNHKYRADYSIFEEINTNEKAYWLGFIAADGCVTDREQAGNSLIISISKKDKELLEKFKIFINTDAVIKEFTQNKGFSNNSEMCRIAINSNQLVKDLNNKGIYSNKSLTIKPPLIKEKYYLPFILGYFDGDGSIYSLDEGKKYCINFTGTKEMLEWINKVLLIEGKLSKRNNNDKNTYYIRCGGTNKPYRIMKKLYDSSNIYLERKHDIFLELENKVPHTSNGM